MVTTSNSKAFLIDYKKNVCLLCCVRDNLINYDRKNQHQIMLQHKMLLRKCRIILDSVRIYIFY